MGSNPTAGRVFFQKLKSSNLFLLKTDLISQLLLLVRRNVLLLHLIVQHVLKRRSQVTLQPVSEDGRPLLIPFGLRLLFGR